MPRCSGGSRGSLPNVRAYDVQDDLDYTALDFGSQTHLQSHMMKRKVTLILILSWVVLLIATEARTYRVSGADSPTPILVGSISQSKLADHPLGSAGCGMSRYAYRNPSLFHSGRHPPICLNSR